MRLHPLVSFLLPWICITAGTPAAGATYLVSAGGDDAVYEHALDGTYLRPFVPGSPMMVDGPQDMVIGPDDRLYLAGWLSQEILVLDPATGEAVADPIPVPAIGAYMPRFMPDGALWVTVDPAGRIMRFDVDTGTALTDAMVPRTVNTPHSFVVVGDELLVTDRSRSRIRRLDLDTGALIDDFATGVPTPQVAVIGPSGDELLVTSWSLGGVMAFDLATGERLPDRVVDPGLVQADGLLVDHQGELLVCGWGSNEVRRYDADTGAFLGVFCEASNPNAIFFHPGGTVDVPVRRTSWSGIKALGHGGS